MTGRHIGGTLVCMSATEEQMFPSGITARLFAWLAPLLLLLAAVAAVPVAATASAKALCVPQNCIGEHSAAAPFAMLPTIASPDWSKNLLVSNDPAHGISKFLGGQALTTLATAGASELPEALSSGTEEATNLLPGATTGVTGLADAKTATTLSEDAVKTPTANTVTAKVPSAAGKATEEELTRFENEGGGQVQGQGERTAVAPTYAHLEDPATVEPGKDFTPAQKAKILEENMKRNGGIVKSDKSGTVLRAPAKSQRGVAPHPDEWQIDHKIPRAKGGTNSFKNAQDLSRVENRAKSNK